MTTEPKSSYPEHDKLNEIRDRSQSIGEFLEWIQEKGVSLASYHKHSDGCYVEHGPVVDVDDCRWARLGDPLSGKCHHKPSQKMLDCGCSEQVLYSYSYGMERLLAEFFEIDPVKLEAEKRAILAEFQRQTAPAGSVKA